MSGFSIDDVRDTFEADISHFLGRIEGAGHALLAEPPSPPPLAAEIAALESLGDCLHTIYGTSTLVGAASLAGTAGHLEKLAETRQAAIRLLQQEQAQARALAALCLEGVRQMRAALTLELNHRRPEAERTAEAFRRERLDVRGEPAAASPRAVTPARGERSEVDRELLAVFREEARGAAAEIDAQLNVLSARGDDFAAASRIEQIFHSLKGAAATVGLEPARELAGRMQHAMQGVLEGDAEVNAGLIATLRESARQLLASSDDASSPGAAYATREGGGADDGRGASAFAADGRGASAFADDAEAEGAPESMRSELFEVFQQEARQSLGALRELVETLKAAPANLGAARDMERLFHTLKGAAATVGLGEVSRIAAGMHARLEGALEAGVAITRPVLREIVEETNKLAGAAGLDELALDASLDAEDRGQADGGQELARQVFDAEARQICVRALALARELPHAASDKASSARAELERSFHRLKGSALITTDPAVAVEAERLQRRCSRTDAAVLAAEVIAGVERLAGLLDLNLQEPSQASQRSQASEGAAGSTAEGRLGARIRETVQLPDPELWESFSQECIELLDAIDRSVLDLETSDQPKKILQDLLRQYHTLKGAANTVGLAPTGRELHRVEDFLESLLAKPILPSMKGIATFLLSVQTDTRRQIKQSTQGWVEVSPGAVEAGIRRALAGDALARGPGAGVLHLPDSGSVHDSAAGAGSGADGSRDGAERKTIRVATERLDTLMNLAGELVVSRSRLMSRVAALGGLREELGMSSRRLLEAVDRFREKHEYSTIAGASPRAAASGVALAPARATDMMQRAVWGSFTELELDRYDDVNVLSRGLAEITDDLGDLNTQLVRELAGFGDDSDAFGTIVNGIQSEVTRARMVPLQVVFTRLRLPVRDAADRDAKEVRVVTTGEEVSLDKTIADALFTPMLHLVRNAVAHGIESPDRRQQSGKPRGGIVTLGAREESGQIVLEVRDDGGGLDLRALHARGVAMGLIAAATPVDDPAVKDLVFAPNFSTRATAGSVSGRGVGGDVARRAIERLNGSIRVETRAGEGTTFVLTLPVTLAITKALLVRQGGRAFALPLHFADRIVDAEDAAIADSAGVRRMKVDGAYVPVRRMDALLRLGDGGNPNGPLIVLRVGTERVALQVEALVGQEGIVVKSAGELLAGHPLFAGVTIRGTGELALIVDVPALLESASARAEKLLPHAGGLTAPRVASPAAPKARAPAARQVTKLQVLFVDDSLSVRRVAEKMLGGLGADVTLANDGLEALARLREKTFDIVFTDLEMPRMHGYDLIRELRFLPAHKDLPVVVVSSRSGQKHQDQAHALGANDYMTKPFSPQMLEGALRRWCATARGQGASADVETAP